MTIKFEDYRTDHAYYEDAEIIINVFQGKKVSLEIHNTTKDKKETFASYQIDKEQLKDFIGALLHVQSKIR